MMMPITEKGKLKLEEKLRVLKKEMQELPAIIQEARSKGDLKENADYHAAKERQGMLNAEIQKISYDLTHSQAIDPKVLAKDIITFGKTVTLIDCADDKEYQYTIVGSSETDTKNNRISINSQLVKSLLGKKVNIEVEVQLPVGIKKYRITNIEVANI